MLTSNIYSSIYLGVTVILAVLLLIFVIACIYSFFYFVKAEKLQKPLTLEMQQFGKILNEATQEEDTSVHKGVSNTSDELKIGNIVIECSPQWYNKATQDEIDSYQAELAAQATK